MKKSILLILVLVLLAVSVGPAYAANKAGDMQGPMNGKQTGRHGKMPYNLAGTISALDPATQTVTVTVVCGNKVAKPYIGQDIILQTKDITRLLLRNPDGVATPITFDDLAVGEKISSQGSFRNGVWTAKRITMGAVLACLP